MISLVLCTYNGERFLTEQLESILGQTLLPDEIILSDDGSTDGTLELARSLLDSPRAAGIRVRIITRQEPLGPAGNFSEALSHATSTFVALADQDDVWHVDKLAVLSARLEGDSTLLAVHSDAALVNASGAKFATLMSSLRLNHYERSSLLRGEGIRALLRRNVVTGATMMIRRELLDSALPIPTGWMHDEWLAVIAALRGGLAWENKELIDYRQHDRNEIGVATLSASTVADRLGESRHEFFQRRKERNAALEALVGESPQWPTDEARAQVRGKLAHDTWRYGLSDKRLARVFPVLARWATGDYRRFARGYIDVLRDIWLRP
jgi:glycosyltransferase involved in cell wall biosynthesis